MTEFRSEVVDHPEFLAAPVDNALILSALELIAKHNLNGTDAILLRSALNIQQMLRQFSDELIFWTSDKRLSRAAQTEGVTVFDPEVDTISHLHHLLGV